MRFSIDVLFLDASNRILKAVSWLKPGNIAGPVRDSAAVLEIPAGELPENIDLVGKKLRFIE